MKFWDLFHEGKKYKEDFCALYESAFPVSEKKPWALMEDLVRKKKMEMLVIAENDIFVGLIINMLGENAAILDYFAISPERRCDGCGSRALQAMLERFSGKQYILEVEMQDSDVPNAEERKRRRIFYMRNGLKSTGLYVNIYQTDFELLTLDGCLTFEQYLEILKEILGQDMLQRLKPCEISKKCQDKAGGIIL